jgi:uncharacterized protein (DUF1778 family)
MLELGCGEYYASNWMKDTLLKLTIFWTTPEKHAEFIKRLNAPSAPNQRLRKTMQMIAPWDKQ